MNRIVGALALLLYVLSAHGADAAFETVDGRVTHIAGGWRVRYQLDSPAAQLRFVDDFGLRRHARWKVETPGLRIVARGGAEFVERSDHQPFSTVTLRFASDLTKLDKKYPLNKTFTDGSEWLCTLLLYAAPVRASALQTRFALTFVPARDERIVLDGQRHAGPARWTDPLGDRGTFVYFGKLTPIESDDLIAVVDPGLPAYLAQQFDVLLPKLFAYYRTHTGYALRTRPVILITYHPAEDLGQGDSGEVLPNVAAFDFRSGEFWQAQSAHNARMSFHLLAHEAAHLWNGNRFESVEGNAAPWMHEGGADAFDWAAARDFGALDDQALRSELEQRLNSCLYQLTAIGVSLQDAFKQQAYELAYSCGSIINFAVDARLRDRGGLFAFWRALFAKAEGSGGRYDVEQYFATLAELDRDGAFIDPLRQIWTHAHADPSVVLRSLLVASGVELTAGTVPPDFERIYARKAISKLMWDDCGSDFSVSTFDDHAELTGLTQCRVLKNRKVAVAALAGVKTIESMKLYAAIAKQCAGSGKVIAQIANSDETLSLHCSAPLPEVAPYLAITNWPH